VSAAERWKHRRPLPANIAERVRTLPALLERHGVELAYLFGSMARPDAGVAHDVDIAVLPGMATDVWALRIAVGEHLGTDRFDLVNLATASPVVRFEVIRAAHPLLRASAEVENSFERRTIAEFKDGEVVRMRRLRRLAGTP
jgi:predicted nucleotidyltransferase